MPGVLEYVEDGPDIEDRLGRRCESRASGGRPCVFHAVHPGEWHYSFAVAEEDDGARHKVWFRWKETT